MFLDGLRSSSLSRLLDWCTCANFLPSNWFLLSGVLPSPIETPTLKFWKIWLGHRFTTFTQMSMEYICFVLTFCILWVLAN
jgi:hypothetical protein